SALRYWRADAHRAAWHDAGLAVQEAHALNRLWDLDRNIDRVGQGDPRPGTRGVAALEERGWVADGAITDEGQKQREAIAAATDALGTISLVANVVGGGSFGMGMGPLTFLPADQFDKIVALNLRSMFLVTKASAARMVAAGTKGAIVSVSSQAGKRGMPM